MRATARSWNTTARAGRSCAGTPTAWARTTCSTRWTLSPPRARPSSPTSRLDHRHARFGDRGAEQAGLSAVRRERQRHGHLRLHRPAHRCRDQRALLLPRPHVRDQVGTVHAVRPDRVRRRVNLYAYVGNDPLNLIDPQVCGRFSWDLRPPAHCTELFCKLGLASPGTLGATSVFIPIMVRGLESASRPVSAEVSKCPTLHKSRIFQGYSQCERTVGCWIWRFPGRI